MPVAVANQITNSSTVDGSSFATASYTPTASGLPVLIGITHSIAAAPTAAASSIAGSSISGATKITSIGFASNATPGRMTDLWVATTTGSAGALTITFPASRTGCSWSIDEVTGADIAQGTLSVVQSVTNFSDSAQTTATCTLGAFANSANATLAASGVDNQNGQTQKSGWTLLDYKGYGTPNVGQAMQWIASNDTSPSATWTGGNAWGMIGIEIAALVTVYDPTSTIPGQFSTRDL